MPPFQGRDDAKCIKDIFSQHRPLRAVFLIKTRAGDVMSLLETRRRMLTFSIQQNPATITIHRTEKVRQGGGFAEVKTPLDPITVRIFQQKDNVVRVISDVSGLKEKVTDFGMLADHNADIRDGPNVRDEFDVPGLGHFVVVSVTKMLQSGEVVGYQVDLERES